jgi:enoyl-CoA hydratase
MLLTGEQIDGRTAVRVGLAQRSVPSTQLRATAAALARRVAALDPRLVRAAKASVQRGADLPLAEALGLERRLAHALRPSAQ